MGAIKVIAAFVSVISAVVAAPVDTKTVDLGYARFKGLQNDTLGITTYYGLRFATPPTGQQRWQPPKAIEHSGFYSGNPLINATAPGFQCHQAFPTWIAALSALGPAFPGADPINTAQKEDCLFLDVIVPQRPVAAKLPVVLQIHGGGYTIGSASGYDGSDFISYSDGSVIYVQIQYRLGVYGFLSSPEIKQSGTANAGLLDQRLAIEWTRKFIGKFGGDPDRVTIWGTSAGGGSVDAQMILYGGVANPPFRAAIAEYPWWQPYHGDAVLSTQYNDLLRLTKCTSLSCLRGLSEDAIASVQQDVYDVGYQAGVYGHGDFYFGPSVDGNIIRGLPSDEFQAGRFSPVPLLTDRNAYEGLIFTNFSLSQESELEPYFQQLWPQATKTFFQHLFSLYPSSDFQGSYFDDPIQQNYSRIIPSIRRNTVFYKAQTIFSDYIINCPSRYISVADTQAAKPVYKMIFRAGIEVHSATLPYLLNPSNSTDNPRLANQMKDYFLSFIVDLNPNTRPGRPGTPARPNWPLYSSSSSSAASSADTDATSDGAVGAAVLQVTNTAYKVIKDTDASARCNFFDSQSQAVRNRE